MGVNNKERRVEIVKDENGKSIVIIKDILFKGRRNINWREVEDYLKEYIGNCYEIIETSEKVYIGSDFPDEFCHSRDTKVLKGTNAKAKANATQVIGELIQIASNRSVSNDFDNKHGKRARNGWYRYDSSFALPIHDDIGKIYRYNVFSVRLLVRCSNNGKLYLYDILRTKKETYKPL